MRQIYQKIGFIVIAIVALVSLPLAIIGLMREPTIINNYYNEPEQIDYSVPLEIAPYYNLSVPQHFGERSYNLTKDNTLYVACNSDGAPPEYYIMSESMLEYFYLGVKCWVVNGDLAESGIYWTPPSFGYWSIVFRNLGDNNNVTMYIEIF